MRKLGVAAASAALIGTIAAVLPAGVAKADVTGAALPDPIAGVCAAADMHGCWRYTSLDDSGGTPGALPTAVGSQLQLNAAGAADLATAAWYNTPIDITGQSIEASYTAYLDSVSPPPPGNNFAHGDGLAFVIIQGHLPEIEVGNNQPAPVPFPDNRLTGVEYGAGGNGLGFSGFDDGDGGPTATGSTNLGFVLTTSADETDVGGDSLYDVSKGGILKGFAWQAGDPHVRQARWYGANPNSSTAISPSIYSVAANGRPVRVGVQLKPVSSGVWHAKMYVDGALLTESNVNLPNVVYFGFTAGSNETAAFAERQAVSDVSIHYGTVVAPTVTATPNPVDFGAVAVGDSVTHNVTLTNNSALPVTLASTVTGGFSVAIPASLSSGESVQVPITFAPQSATR